MTSGVWRLYLKKILNLPEGWKEYEEENLDKELENLEQSEVGKQSRVDEDIYGEKLIKTELSQNWLKSFESYENKLEFVSKKNIPEGWKTKKTKCRRTG